MVAPGSMVRVSSELKVGQGKWSGFARGETLEEVWDGWVPLDIPVDAFAEHNRPASKEANKRVLTWVETDKGSVISGIGNRATGAIRIVTREATEEEFEAFGHNRLPQVIDSRY